MVAGWHSIAEIYWIMRDYVSVEAFDSMLKRIEHVDGNTSMRETVVRLGKYHEDHREHGMRPASMWGG